MNIPKTSFQLSSYSLKQLQEFNQTVYVQQNGRNFELHDMVCRLSRFNARVLHKVRKETTERTGYHLCMMLSWLCAIANRLYLDVHETVAAHCAMTLPIDAPFDKMQTVFASRHVEVTLQNACLCLAEKVLGLASALEYYRETHEEAYFRDMAKKMAQSIEALSVVASLLGIKLNEELEKHFANGCSGCNEVPCRCGFRADKVV